MQKLVGIMLIGTLTIIMNSVILADQTFQNNISIERETSTDPSFSRNINTSRIDVQYLVTPALLQVGQPWRENSFLNRSNNLRFIYAKTEGQRFDVSYYIPGEETSYSADTKELQGEYYFSNDWSLQLDYLSFEITAQDFIFFQEFLITDVTASDVRLRNFINSTTAFSVHFGTETDKADPRFTETLQRWKLSYRKVLRFIKSGRYIVTEYGIEQVERRTINYFSYYVKDEEYQNLEFSFSYYPNSRFYVNSFLTINNSLFTGKNYNYSFSFGGFFDDHIGLSIGIILGDDYFTYEDRYSLRILIRI